MTEQNRFTRLIGGLNQDKPAATKTDESVSASKPKSKKPLPKSKDPNYSQIGLYLPKELHQKMKIGAAMTGLEMSAIAEAGIQMWLDKNVPDK